MKSWKKTLRIIRGVLYVTLSNVPVKKKPIRCMQPYHGRTMYKMRLRHVKDVGYCPLCGKEVTKAEDVQVHHVLPVSKFPDLMEDRRNMIVVCIDCHNEIHENPWLDIMLMEPKAKELCVNLDTRYNIRPIT